MPKKQESQPKPITKQELARVLGSIPWRISSKELRNSMVCALVGHSRIVTMCFGYINCGRCEAQIGDTLGGASSAKGLVVVGYNCKECRATAKLLTWRDTLYAKNPFPKKQAV